MRTTVNIDEHLLGEAKVKAAREHRTIGSVLEEALRQYLEGTAPAPSTRYELPRFDYSGEALVDINDSRALGELFDDEDPFRRG